MTTEGLGIVPNVIPSKYDIIPIHASDRGTFKSCRRKWDWSSPMRNNLVPKPEEHGVAMPLWFGSGIHWALKHYYDPLLRRDPVETFKTWWNLQWYGGTITEDWLDASPDSNPQQVDNGMYKARGLEWILPMAEVEREAFEEHLELGVGMLTFYKEYAALKDNFTVLAAEHTFSVPIYDFDNDCEMVRVDPRDGQEKPVHLRGTQDAIIQDNETGKYGILEHKSAIKIDDEYFVKLDKDEQCTTYMFAGEVEAKVNGFPYTNIEFVLYNAIRKAFPRPPTITKRGDISIDRTKESTTYEMLMDTIDEYGLTDFWELDEKLKNYVEYVKEKGDEQFVVRTPVYRNRHEIYSCGERVFYEARDMLNDPAIYPNPTGQWNCLRCIFRAPCIAKDDGSDWQMMLDDQFEKNRTR